jgi:hypothetical protein
MSLHVITCHYMSLHVITCHYMSLHVITCHYMHVITCHYMSLHVITCHNMSLHVITCHYISLHVITCHYRFDDFAYFYHRYTLPRLNYTLCTGGKDTLDGQGDLKRLHKHFLPDSFWHGQKFDDLDTLQSLLKKPLWQVN